MLKNVNITMSASPAAPLCATQLFMSQGENYCYMQLDNEYLKKNLQKHIQEGFEMLSKGSK